jgi:HlyD family secretion protein
MDIARPSIARQRRIRRVIYSLIGALVILAITLGLSRLKPAAPTVESSTVWPDTVKRGPMLCQIHGLGTLVPEEIRWIPALTEGRVERLRLLLGAVTRFGSSRKIGSKAKEHGS